MTTAEERKNVKPNLLATIKKIANKQPITEAESRQDHDNRERAKAMGMNPNGMLAIETRSAITYDGKTEYYTTKDSVTDSPIWERFTKVEDMFVNTSFPYFAPSGVTWSEDGTATDGNQYNSKKLKPYRLVTLAKVSNSLFNYHDKNTFENELFAILQKAVREKITESIFSDFSGSTDQPKGIFDDVSSTTITAITDVIEMQYNGDKAKTNNVWVISPKAKKELLKIDKNIFDDGKLLGSEYIFLNQMQDGYIAYLPLDLVVLSTWNIATLDVDGITEAHKGITNIVINYYADFDFLDKTKIQLGNFED